MSNIPSMYSQTALIRSKDIYYTVPELRTIVDEYITSQLLIHHVEPAYTRLDDWLRSVLLKKGEETEFLKRDELSLRLRSNMQAWYSIQVDGKEPLTKYADILALF